jgi:hypothetical protein
MELTPAVGDQLRDEWYQKRLRSLYDAGSLFEYTSTDHEADRFGTVRDEGVGQAELSLLDYIPANGLRDVQCGGDGAERNVPAGLLEGGDSANPRKPLAACAFEATSFLSSKLWAVSGRRHIPQDSHPALPLRQTPWACGCRASEPPRLLRWKRNMHALPAGWVPRPDGNAPLSHLEPSTANGRHIADSSLTPAWT